MRRFFQIFGMIAALVVIVAGIGLGVLVHKGRALDGESRSFVDGAVPAITGHWDTRQFMDRASPQLLRSLGPNQISDVFRMLLVRRGPLVEYRGAKGDANMSYFSASGATISANYVAKATYSYGSAAIRLLLVKRNGRWLIQGFHVEPVSTGPVPKGT